MAYYQEPDRIETYINRDISPHQLIVSYYNDTDGFVNWHLEDYNKTVYDAGTNSIEEMKTQIKVEGWKEVRSWNASNTMSQEQAKKREDQCVKDGGHHWFGVGGTGVSKCWNCEKCVSSD